MQALSSFFEAKANNKHRAKLASNPTRFNSYTSTRHDLPPGLHNRPRETCHGQRETGRHDCTPPGGAYSSFTCLITKWKKKHV